jgi:SagB-type dehydrogenase family enzyme
MKMADLETSPAKDSLLRLISTLSDFECARLLRLIGSVAAGERPWERGIGAVYHEQTKMRRLNQGASVPAAPETEQGLFAPVPIVKSYPGAERVALLEPQRPDLGLGDAILRRRSRRELSGAPISLQDLSTLIALSCGVNGRTQGYGYSQLPLRTFPSSGGLQAPEVYLSVQAIDGIPPGLYHYHAVDHVLELLQLGNHGAPLQDFCLGQPQLKTAAAVVLITGCLDRVRWKYGDRALKYVCMDCGYLGQNLYLVGEAMGLAVCAIAGFFDDAIEQLLGIDGDTEIALLLTTVGRPAGS